MNLARSEFAFRVQLRRSLPTQAYVSVQLFCGVLFQHGSPVSCICGEAENGRRAPIPEGAKVLTINGMLTCRLRNGCYKGFGSNRQAIRRPAPAPQNGACELLVRQREDYEEEK
jgi:hypothetical protein